MSDLIIVCGLPATGKTTLATELSKALRIPCIHKDHLKEKLYELLGTTSMLTYVDSKRIGAVSIELLISMAEQNIENGVDLIIEAPFAYEKDNEKFWEWSKKFDDLNIYTIICSIDAVTRQKRFTTRERHQSHHDQERDFSQLYSEEIAEQYYEFPGKHIPVTTDREINTIVSELLLSLAY